MKWDNCGFAQEESSKPAAATYLIDQGSDTYVPEAPLHYTPYSRYTDEGEDVVVKLGFTTTGVIVSKKV